MTVVTQKLTNIAGVSRTATVQFRSAAVRTVGANLVIEDVQMVKPAAGVITVDLQPGPAIVAFGGKEFAFTVPASGTPTLSTLIAAALGIPAGTPDVVVGAAVEAYLLLNPPAGGGSSTVDTLSGATATGRASMKAADAAAGRAAIGAESAANRNVANGYAGLDATGKIAQAAVPSIALQEFLGAVATQAAMLALAGERGDWCTRTDRGTDFQLTAEPSSTLANWRERTYPASPVTTVAGRNGAVVLSKADVALSNVDNTSDANKPIPAAQLAVNAKTTLDQYVSLHEPALYPGVTFTIGTAAPSWISTYIAPTLQGTRFTVVGPPLISDGQSSPSYWASWNGSNNGANVVSHEDAMFVQGPKITSMVYSYGDMDIQVMVDGKIVKPSWSVFPNTAGFYFATLEFTDDISPTKIRNIRWFYGQVGLYQYVMAAGQDMWPDNTKRYTFGNVAFDSYMHGAGGTTEGSISGGTIAMAMALFTGGRTRLINGGAVGGTSYRNPGTGTTAATGPNGESPYGSANRKTKAGVWISKADCLIIGGGANDGDDATYPVATVVAAAQQCWTDYAALAPGKPLLVLGVESGVFPNIAAKLDALNTALRNAAVAHPNVTAYIDMRAGQLVTGTGRINNKVGDGNADIMICSDGVHLTRFGHEYLVRQIIALLGLVLVPRI